MQFTKFVEGDEENHFWIAYVEHVGVLYEILKIEESGDDVHYRVAPLFRCERLKVKVHLDHRNDRCDLEGVEIGDDDYFTERDLENGSRLHIPHDDYLGFEIAVELLQVGWSMEQIAKVKNFATEHDVNTNEDAILAALKKF